MTTDPRIVYEQINKGKVSPFYYIYGPERFIVDELALVLRKKIVGDGLSDFNHNIFYPGEHSVAEIIDAVNTQPMLSAKRLVEVRGTDNFSSKELNSLLPIFDEVSSSVSVVFLAEEIDRRSKFIKVCLSKGIIIECRHPYEDQVSSWVQYIAKKIGKKIDEKSIPYLLAIVGNRLQDIYNELIKASSYVGDKDIIELEDLRTIASPLKEVTVFDYTKAISNKDIKGAVKLLNSLLVLGEPEPVIFSMIVRQWRLLLRGVLMLRKGTPPQIVGDNLKIHRFFQRDFFDQCKRHHPSELRSQFYLLHDADLRIKRSYEDKRLILEELTLSLCGK